MEEREKIIEDYKNSVEYKRSLQSEGDRRATQATETFIKEKLPIHVQKEIEKMNAPDPHKELERVKRQYELKTKILEFANEKKIPLEIANKYLADTEEETFSGLDELTELWTEGLINGVNERIKASGSTPPRPGQSELTPNRADLKTMSPERIVKFFKAGKLNDMMGVK